MVTYYERQRKKKVASEKRRAELKAINELHIATLQLRYSDAYFELYGVRPNSYPPKTRLASRTNILYAKLHELEVYNGCDSDPS